jgi:hypothetical protein
MPPDLIVGQVASGIVTPLVRASALEAKAGLRRPACARRLQIGLQIKNFGYARGPVLRRLGVITGTGVPVSAGEGLRVRDPSGTPTSGLGTT